MKKILTIVSLVMVLVLMTLGLASCASKASETTAASTTATTANVETTVAEAKKVIGISVSGFQAPYFKALIAAAEAEASVQGVELKVLDAEWDAQKQASQVESLIQQKCDVIQIIPCDSTAIIPTMKKVKEANIPLFIVNTQHDPSSEDLIVSFIGASMEDEASLAADSVKKILGEAGGSVVMIEGAAGSFPAIHRSSGFMDAIKDSPNVKVVANQNAGWDRAQAQKVMEDFLTRFDKIDVLYAHDDNMAIGAIQAIKAAGRMEQIKVVSISGTIEGYDAIRAGEIFSTVSQPPDWEGKAAVEYAVKYLSGEKIDKWVKTPIAQVTSENVDQFKGVW